MTIEERHRLADSFLGREVRVVIDRPVGYVHRKPAYTLEYPVNYGYLPGVTGGDGEELDVYVLGPTQPLREFTGRVIGVVYRSDDIEDKLIAAPEGMSLNQAEICEAIEFQEKYYHSEIDCIEQKSCGAIIYRMIDGYPQFLLLYQEGSGTWSFPKGHAAAHETENETAMREIKEEIGCSFSFADGFRASVRYRVNDRIHKQVVLFLAVAENPEICLREGEIGDCRWLSAPQALPLLYDCYTEVFRKLEEYFGMSLL